MIKKTDKTLFVKYLNLDKRGIEVIPVSQKMLKAGSLWGGVGKTDLEILPEVEVNGDGDKDCNKR